MTSLFGKIGTGAEKVYNVTSYPIAWTQSLYGYVTDYAVLPVVKGIWNKVSAATESLDQEEELPKRPKRCGKCFDPKLLYNKVTHYVNKKIATEYALLPVVYREEPLVAEEELPKPPKWCGKCFDPRVVYKVCKTIKEYTYSVAHAKTTELPDPETLDRFDRTRNNVCGNAEKAVIGAFRIIYVAAEIGEKPIALRLYVTEMGFELRPSVMQHVVQPIFKDLKEILAGPKIDSSSASWSERFASGFRSGAGDFFEKGGVALTNEFLTEKEQQIVQGLSALEEKAQTQAIILLSKVSNYMLREGLYFIATPWLLSYISSPLVSSIGYYTGYVETVNTVAYILSYLKYAAWAKTAFTGAQKLYESCPPELTDQVRKQLYKSFTGKKTNPSEKLSKIPYAVTAHYVLPDLLQKLKVTIIGLAPPFKGYIEASDSKTLQKLAKYNQNFFRALKTKSDETLRKYDLIGPRVEEVIDEEIPEDLDPEVALVPTTPSTLSTETSPKIEEVSDASPSIFGIASKTAELTKDAFAIVRSEKKDKFVSRTPAPPPSLVSFVDRVGDVTSDFIELIDGEHSSSEKVPGTPSTSSPSSPDLSILASPRKPQRPKESTDHLSSLLPDARRVAMLIDEALSSSSAASPPKVEPEKSEESEASSSRPRSPSSPRTLSDRTTLLPPPEAPSAEPKRADGAREEPKETPPTHPHWIRRAAVVTILAGAAIVIGIKILNRFSLAPSLPKFSLPANIEDSNAMKILSSLAKLLLRLFKESRVESAKGA